MGYNLQVMQICDRCDGTGFNFKLLFGEKHWIPCFVCDSQGTIDFVFGAISCPPLLKNIQIREGKKGKSKTNIKTIEFKLDELNPKWMMAHLMHHAGCFSSISQARKNGWNKILEKGEFKVGTKLIRII